MMSVRPLGKSFAGELRGVDLRQPMSDDSFTTLLGHWSRFPVLVIPGQDLSIEEHQAFTGRFGSLMERARPAHERGEAAQANPYMMLVSNIRVNGKLIGSSADGLLEFHSDAAFNPVPPMASMLFGIEIPSVGGDTLFVSMYDVYESLTQEIKQEIAHRKAVNYHTYDESGVESGKKREERGKSVRHAVHPMVIRHPVTGKPVLYVNRHMTREIVGMDEQRSSDLLQSLFAKIEREERIYAHKWRPGDLVIWDNRCVQHGRSDFAPTERRLLRRFAVNCDAPPQPYHDVV